MTTPITTTMTHPQTPATFCIWLQGFLDGAGGSLDANQLTTLKAKLDTVFTHPEPDSDSDRAILTERPDPFSEKVIEDVKKQKALDDFIDDPRSKKWVYDGPPTPKTWPLTWPYPYCPPEGPGRWWPTPAINC
jgi:hypothetical protein